MQYLTVKQLSDACAANRYLLVRFANGYLMGVNGRVAPIAYRKKNIKNPSVYANQRTDYVSYRPCGILEYIEHKHPFISY